MRIGAVRILKLIAPALLSLLFGAFVSLSSLAGQPQSAQAATGATLSFPSSACSQSVSANVTFNWTPISGATQQWLDTSVIDNNFAPDTFTGTGPLSPSTASLKLPGIQPGAPNFWRVNALTAAGWVVSTTGAFVPCGGPILLNSSPTCNGGNAANLDFHWAPMSSPGIAQWLDLGADPGFAPDTFVGAGPLAASDQSYHWVNILANTRFVFRINTLTETGWQSSAVGEFTANCAPAGPAVTTELYGSGDRLVIPRLGVDAPVNVRDVQADGAMGNPAGPIDVVRYNFALFPGLGGYPGGGGNTTIAGHVDYYSYGLAVFAPLRYVQEGDIIEYYRWDGVKVTYRVEWYADLPPDYPWGQIVASTNPEALTLITCNGDFNYYAREYSHRRVVRAVRIS